MNPAGGWRRLSDRLRRFSPVLVLLLAIGAFFAPLLAGRTFSAVPGYQNVVYPWAAWPNGAPFPPQSDQVELSLPWQALFQRAVRGGEAPWWNPYGFGGQPLFSNGSSAMLSPLRWLTLPWTDLHRAHEVLCVTVVVLAGLCQFALLRSLGCEAWGAAAGAIIWSLCPYGLGWLHLEVTAPVLVVTPLVAALVVRALRRRSTPALALAAAAAAFGLHSGHLLFMTFAVGGGFVFGLSTALSRARPSLADLVRAAGIGVLAALLGAPALYPTFLTIRDSPRAPLPFDVAPSLTGVPRRDLAAFLSPPAVVDEAALHRLAYVGLVPLALAIAGLAGAGRAAIAPAALIAGVLLVMHSPLLPLLYRIAPGLTLFRLGRLYFLTTFALSVLAAWGLHRLRERARGAVMRPSLTAAVLLLSAVDLVATGRRLNPPSRPRASEELMPATSLIVELRSAATGDARRWVRIAPVARDQPAPPVLPAGIPAVFGVDSIGGYDSVVPRGAVQAIQVLEGRTVAEALSAPPNHAYRPWLTASAIRPRLLARLGVTHLVLAPGLGADRGWRARLDEAGVARTALYEGVDGEIHALAAPGGPRVVCHALAAADAAEALTRFLAEDFDAQAQVLLEAPGAPGTSCAAAPARVVRRTMNELVIDVAGGGGWLVVPQTGDRGWRAVVDGAPAEVLRANGFQQAVRLPASSRRVVLSYEPAGLRAGVAVACGTMVVLAAVIAAEGRASRPPRTPARTHG